MLRSFMIISGQSGIVLFRKVFVKSVGQPRLLGGLVTALCEFSAGALGFPVAYMELEHVAITVVEQQQPFAESASSATAPADRLRCVTFHDAEDGELYGRLIAEELLHAFADEYSERLASLSLATTEGVEDLFKAFNSRVRFALQSVVQPLMRHLERERSIHRVLLLKHARGAGAFAYSPREVWYSGGGDESGGALADVKAMVQVADDLLAAKRDRTAVVLIGERIRVERLALGTLIVATAAPETCLTCSDTIDAAVAVLQRLFALIPVA